MSGRWDRGPWGGSRSSPTNGGRRPATTGRAGCAPERTPAAARGTPLADRRRDEIDRAVVLGMSMWSGMSEGGPTGLSYAAILVRLDAPAVGRQQVLDALHSVRFTGWLGPEEQGWVVAVAERGAGTVAAHRRGVLGVAEDLAGRLGVPLVAVRVAGDRQLALSVWADGAEVGRYVS